MPYSKAKPFNQEIKSRSEQLKSDRIKERSCAADEGGILDDSDEVTAPHDRIMEDRIVGDVSQGAWFVVHP
jgi:hypothetical protein